MLRVTKLTDYAIVVVAELARHLERSRSAAEVASETGVPAPTVSKVLKKLVHADLVTSTRGARGGYQLGRRPAEITLASIVTAVEGPIAMTECCTETPECEQESSCTLAPNWQVVNRAVESALSAITLEQMIRPMEGGLVRLGTQAAESTPAGSA